MKTVVFLKLVLAGCMTSWQSLRSNTEAISMILPLALKLRRGNWLALILESLAGPLSLLTTVQLL